MQFPIFFTEKSHLTIFLIFFTYTLFSTNFRTLRADLVSSNYTTMKVHPLPMRTNITIQYDINPTQSIVTKKLRRLPHVFSRVLELPFRSDADVSIEENQDCFRFVAETDCLAQDVRAQTIEIHPGVSKIVIRPTGSVELGLDGLELDVWRFRLPESTRPELASAVCVDGELVVTVPKGGGGDDVGMWGGDGNGDRGIVGNSWLVVVQ